MSEPASYGQPTSAPQYPPPPPRPSYPPPPAPPQRQLSGAALAAIIIASVIAAIAFVAVAAGVLAARSDGSNDATSSEQPASKSTPTQPPGPETYAVGDTAHTSDIDVTVYQVKDPYVSAGEFEVAQPGNRLVAVELEVKDTTGGPQVFSMLVQTELADSLNQPWKATLGPAGLPSVDGDIPADGARRGWVLFEVPADATGLQLRVKGDLTATGATFQL